MSVTNKIWYVKC